VRFAFVRLGLCSFSQFVLAQDGRKPYVEDELLVKLKAARSPQRAPLENRRQPLEEF